MLKKDYRKVFPNILYKCLYFNKAGHFRVIMYLLFYNIYIYYHILENVHPEYEEKHYFECIVYNGKDCFVIGSPHSSFFTMTTK